MIIKNKVYGVDLTEDTKCKHYNSDRDVIAIRFKCCMRYFACYLCHLEIADHPVDLWNPQDFDIPNILCGKCKYKLTIRQYLTCDFICPSCKTKFNPGCQSHQELYFRI